MFAATQPMAQPMVPEPHRVLRVQKETRDSFTLETRPVEGSRQVPFHPGQFSMLYVFGVGEVPISISGDPQKTDTLLHTIRAVGTVTRHLKKLRKGDVIGIRGPFGSHWPVEAAEGNDVVFIAGGIGLAPLRPAIYQVLARREKYGDVFILYGARTPADMIYRKELEAWRGRFDLKVDATVDTAQRGWLGNVGVVTQIVKKAKFDPHQTVAMICGPEVMMRFTVKELMDEGLTGDDIYLTMERNMKCAVGFCGHCQYGPEFVCLDGPVFSYQRIRNIFGKREI
ncbi:FAD/NAD(P)-binding protein [Nitrospina gracilis]|uniref:FAD/NAD(P)-binding protein n=1 Tax=Nitrospina gracilis TaxID=35801 RepID=UPI001F474A3E|nr:FAD/NAD(P)-binding protein [Nitrospina gracilis]MCF8719125.1 NAD(P)H-flavin reductase [Nitrospina gracilis Nb-211]